MNAILQQNPGKDIYPHTQPQEALAQSMDNNTVGFATGPAGTGKTMIAVCLALSAFYDGDVDEILLTRPAVQAGEDLGFLPGDLDEKLEPYVRPFDGILHQLMGEGDVWNLRENGHLRYEPLGFLRGRTIANSFAILDEAQNATRSQLEMFLTRLGPNSKAIITGDPEQTDLPHPPDSALYDAEWVLGDVNDITFTEFGVDDIVRHDVVRDVIEAYREENRRRTRKRENSDETADDTPENRPDPSEDLGDMADAYDRHEEG